MKKYHFPDCLRGQCEPDDFDHWLERKARALLKRDRKRGNSTASREIYKVAIHGAILRSRGRDEYTGQPLDWSLISKYDNDDSKKHGREYKKRFGNLPTVDHIDEGLGVPDFAICSWRVNDSKNDLTIEEFVQLCKQVIRHQEGQPSPSPYSSPAAGSESGEA